MRLVKAAKASPHAKFYNLSTDYNEAKRSGKKVLWKISAEMYCLYTEEERFVPKRHFLHKGTLTM